MSSVKDTHTISDNSLFTGIATKKSFKPIAKNFENFNEGDIIYQSGNNSEYFYLLIEGEVKLKFTGARGRDFITKTKKDFFGEKELLEKTERQSSAVANTNCILYKLRLKDLNMLIEKFPSVKQNIERFNFNAYNNTTDASLEDSAVNKIPFDLEKDTIKIKDIPVKKEKPKKEKPKKEIPDEKDTGNKLEDNSEESQEVFDLNNLDEDFEKLDPNIDFNLDSGSDDEFELNSLEITLRR